MENKEDFIKEWLEGKVSAEELKSRRENGDGIVKEYDELITRSSLLHVPESVSKDEAWRKLSSKLNEPSGARAKAIQLNPWMAVGIAASVTLIAVAFFVFRTATVATRMAETKVYVLPDGSTVTLNADSRLSFNRIGWSDNREVTLEGEAFFEVTKGSSFTVTSERGSVTVLGTSFNVHARPSAYEVSCFTGKVRVAAADKSVILTKGLNTAWSENGLATPQAFDQRKTTWRQGDFYFEAASLDAVMEELERQFDVEITYQGDPSRKYTGYFSNKNLDEALAMVFKPMSLQYTVEKGNKITVK
jgi:ferric-dicitrate binding protein FerR (iron transport regulator)